MLLARKANKSPCKDCFDRTMTCHSVCQRYKEYRKRQDEILNEKLMAVQSTPHGSPSVRKRIWKEMKKR